MAERRSSPLQHRVIGRGISRQRTWECLPGSFEPKGSARTPVSHDSARCQSAGRTAYFALQVQEEQSGSHGSAGGTVVKMVMQGRNGEVSFSDLRSNSTTLLRLWLTSFASSSSPFHHVTVTNFFWSKSQPEIGIWQRGKVRY